MTASYIAELNSLNLNPTGDAGFDENPNMFINISELDENFNNSEWIKAKLTEITLNWIPKKFKNESFKRAKFEDMSGTIEMYAESNTTLNIDSLEKV